MSLDSKLVFNQSDEQFNAHIEELRANIRAEREAKTINVRRHGIAPSHDGKADSGKDPWDLLLWRAAREVVRVRAFGVAKYGASDSWRSVPDARRRYFAATLRHVTAWFGGERLDHESGLPHLAHAVCCLMFLLETEAEEWERK